MKRLVYTVLVLGATLSACSGEGNQKTEGTAQDTASTEVKEEKVCTYAYNPESTEVRWKAYKYTEKAGVAGVFDSLMVKGTQSGNSIASVLQGAEVEIQTSSVNSGDPTRDPKIIASFFGQMVGSETMTGKVVSMTGDDQSGTVTFDLTMNGITKPIQGEYTVNGSKLEVKSDITVETWNAMPAIEALNKVCEDLHKGADGKSILWPDVTLYISTELTKNCD